MLLAVFYARFHPERGPSVIHKYPDDFVIAPLSHPDSSTAHVRWGEVSSYIIPAFELCNRTLSLHNGGHIILGFPVSLEDEKYERNRFTFNVCFVLSAETDAGPWLPLVRKTAAFFTALEVEDGLLQAEERLPGLKWAADPEYPVPELGVVHSVLEGLLEDINAFGETCVRLDDKHVLNLRLAPPRQAVSIAKVRRWDVPLLIRPLPEPEEWTWDLTLARIREHIDGVNHVQRIAELADSEIKLVKKAIHELIYHGRVLLLDLFHFQAIYIPTPEFALFAVDEALLDECSHYVAIDPTTNIFADAAHKSHHPQNGLHPPPLKHLLITLYRSLTPGLSIHNFVLAHQEQLADIDIRRLITFGVLKGFLRRVHRYALAFDRSAAGSESGSTQLAVSGTSPAKRSSFAAVARPAGLSPARIAEDAQEAFDRAWRKAALSSGWATPPADLPGLAGAAALTAQGMGGADLPDGLSDADEKLRRYLDGRHCLDQICVEMHMSEKKVVERVSSGRFGDVVFFSR